MAIVDDFEFDWNLKRLSHISGKTTVYTANQLFTLVQRTIPQPQNMDDDEIMTAETPTAYTVKDGWFIDPGDGSEFYKFLSGGAIQTNGYGSGEILVIKIDGSTDCLATDIGKTVFETSDIGPLLGYKNDYPVAGEAILYVRDTNTHGQVDDGDSITITTGQGAGTANGDSVSGEFLYANPYTLGSFPGTPNPQTYVFQDRHNVAEWWSRGNIDILVEVKEGGIEIDDQFITVFARQQGDTFTHYRIQLTAAGQNAVPLETTADILDTQGDYYLFYDTGTTATDFTAGELIQEDSGNWEAEVVNVAEWSSGAGTATGVLEVRGYRVITTALANNDTFTGATSAADAACNGVLGDTYLTYNGEGGTPPTSGSVEGSVTGAKRLISGIQDDGTTGKLNLRVDGTTTGAAREPQYTAFNATENVEQDGTPANYYTSNLASTTITSGYSDITVAFVNGTFTYDDSTAGDLTPGERVTYNTTEEGIFIFDSNAGGGAARSGTVTLGNASDPILDNNVITGDLSAATVTPSQDLQAFHTVDFAHTQQTAYPYGVFIEGGTIYEAGRPLSEIFPYLKFVCQENNAHSMFTMRQVLKLAYDYDHNGGSGSTYTDVTTEAKDTSAGDLTFISSTDGEVDDAHYFGSDERFGGILVNVSQAAVGTFTILWEYWNGAWVNLATGHNLTDGTTGFTASGENWVNYDWPTDWALTAVDGESRFWIRARVSAFTSCSTSGLGTQVRTVSWEPAPAGSTNSEDGEEYTTAFDGYAETKAAPFGQKLGSTFFGAQSVWLQGMDSDDANNISFKDANGTARDPYQSIVVKIDFPSGIGNGATGFVARASGGAVEEFLTSDAAANAQGDLTFEVQEDIGGATYIDLPTFGVLKVVHADTGLDHRYRYASWDGGTPDVFTLNTKIGPTACTGGGTGTLLQDNATNDFTAIDVEEGDIVRNETDASWAHVISITDADNIVTTPLQGGGDDTWTATDNYSFHNLVVAYDGSDTAYVPYLDGISSSDTFQVTVLFAANRTVVAKGRKAGRKPYDNGATGSLTNAGFTASAIMPAEPQYDL